MLSILGSGIWMFISTIAGRILGMMEERNRAAIEERQALFAANKLVVEDRARAQKLPEANFARRLIALAMTATLIFIVYIGLYYPQSEIIIPVANSGSFGLFSLLFGSGGGVKFVAVNTSVVIVPFIDMLGIIIGFYFGSGGSLRGLR